MSAPEFDNIHTILKRMSNDSEHVNAHYYRQQVRSELRTLQDYIDTLEKSHAMLATRLVKK